MPVAFQGFDAPHGGKKTRQNVKLFIDRPKFKGEEKMGKRVLFVLMGTLLLGALLTACDGGSKITDGLYLPDTDRSVTYYSFEFKNGEVTLAQPGMAGTMYDTGKYTYDGKILSVESSILSSLELSITVVDKDTIRFGGIDYIRQP